MAEQQIKTRFCPSPTGELHIGSARTALFNWLMAKKHGGMFLLRIEDTDEVRSSDVYTQRMMRDLRWLGLDWDEGPEAGGDLGPYYQSQRQRIYDQYYDRLEQQGHAFPCFCSEQELQVARKAQLAAGKPPRYPGTCRNLTQSEIDDKRSLGLEPALRFKVPDNEVITFHDLVHGRHRFQSRDIGDFIIRRADGTPPFMFSNAVDDALMGVTHALRGDDHVTNTPRQLLILQALDLPAPYYAHIALIMGAEGGPLSKRLGSLSMERLRDAGYFPDALNNYLARLGHYTPYDDWLDRWQLAEMFNTDNLNTAPAHFDERQLQYWQHRTMQMLEPEAAQKTIEQYVNDWVPEAELPEFISTVKPNIDFPSQARAWAIAVYSDHIDYSDEARQWLTNAGPAFFRAAKNALQQHGLDYQKLCESIKSETGVKGKGLFKPLRSALTGEVQGPELANLVTLMGDQRVSQRLNDALKQVEA